MKFWSVPVFFWLIGLSTQLYAAPGQTLKVLQFNIWSEGTTVENGFEGIVDNLAAVHPDVVTFSEVRNYDDSDFIARLLAALQQKGLKYYGQYSVSTGIISRYPIKQQSVVYPYENDQGSVLKALIEVGQNTLAIYSAHLDYRHYACYLPRGCSGTTWKKLKEPVTDPELILAANRKSFRDEAINATLKDARQETEKGHLVIIGGDFNEPSHLDWQADTKDLWDHNGAVVEWECSKLLHACHFVDSYRQMHPDVLNYPGFTFPSDNPAVPVSKLTWAPEADERERIDFIYYYPNPAIALKEVQIVGPSSSIVRSVRREEQSKDRFILPQGIWPTDHKAVLASFILQETSD